MRALLVHSPLVGPATMLPLAGALEQRGWAVRVPDLRDAITSPSVFAARASSPPDVDVVVGHSGAGAVLPSIAVAVAATATVFVDAILPPAGTVYEVPDALRMLLDSLPVVDGVLPPWDEWWPPEALRELVPDDAVRAAVVAELPQVRRSFFDELVALPDRWWVRPAAYLQLSPAYDEERTRAEAWGWPTSRLDDGGHLDTASRAQVVAAQLQQLVSTIGPTR